MVRLLKSGLRAMARTDAMARFVSRLEAFGDRRSNLLRVLTYHRVDWPDTAAHLHPGTLSATPDEFSEQMAYFSKHYQVVDIHAVLAAIRNERELPPKSLLITFDDAYCDFYEHAWPTLRKLSLPAVLFVPTEFVENRELVFWWDRLHQAAWDSGSLNTSMDRQRFRAMVQRVKALPHHEALAMVDEFCETYGKRPCENHVMTWEVLKQLSAEGLDLAPHTRTHPLMTRISIEEAIDEANGSRADLHREIGTDLGAIAYPAGAYSPELVQPLRDAGFEVAFTTQRGINDLSTTNPLLLQRINVSDKTPRTILRAQLLSSMRHFLPLTRFAAA